MMSTLRLLLSLVLLSLPLACASPNTMAWEAVHDSWEALRPYAQAGVASSTLSDDARKELEAEISELTATIDTEVEHGQ